MVRFAFGLRGCLGGVRIGFGFASGFASGSGFGGRGDGGSTIGSACWSGIAVVGVLEFVGDVGG